MGEDEREELGAFLLVHREALAPIIKMARDDTDMLEIARRHRAVLASPGDWRALDRWLALLAELKAT